MNKYQLARWMHEEYESIAEENGWETQKITRVDFDDLPESNRITMITLAERIINLKTLLKQ